MSQSGAVAIVSEIHRLLLFRGEKFTSRCLKGDSQVQNRSNGKKVLLLEVRFLAVFMTPWKVWVPLREVCRQSSLNVWFSVFPHSPEFLPLPRWLSDNDFIFFYLQDDKKFYQLELVNRETNFNKVFNASPNVGVINPLIKVGSNILYSLHTQGLSDKPVALFLPHSKDDIHSRAFHFHQRWSTRTISTLK